MNINVADICYNYHQQPTIYREVISFSASSGGTFDNLNDMFEKLSLSIKKTSDRKKILDLYDDCVCFGQEESKKLSEYIERISIEEKDNIFDYYD